MALNDEKRDTSGTQPGQPGHEQIAQRGLTNSDRRIRPYSDKPDILRNVFRLANPHIPHTESFRVAGRQFQRPLVDIDRPHRRAWRPLRQGEGDRPITASKIEQITRGWGRGDSLEQHPRPRIDPIGGEDPSIRRQFKIHVGKNETHHTGPAGRLRPAFEVLLRHRSTVAIRRLSPPRSRKASRPDGTEQGTRQGRCLSRIT
jgi:hypothetical protein